MRKIITAIAILMVTLSVSFGQTRQDAAPYDFSVGVNVGFFNGFTFKFFPVDNFGVQLDLGYRFMWDYKYNYIPTILSWAFAFQITEGITRAVSYEHERYRGVILAYIQILLKTQFMI